VLSNCLTDRVFVRTQLMRRGLLFVIARYHFYISVKAFEKCHTTVLFRSTGSRKRSGNSDCSIVVDFVTARLGGCVQL